MADYDDDDSFELFLKYKNSGLVAKRMELETKMELKEPSSIQVNPLDVVSDMGFDTWMPWISDKHTFKSQDISISRDEAKVLITHIEQFQCIGGRLVPNTESHSPPSRDDLLLIDGIRSKLDSVIQSFGGLAFVKLSSRSPKDAVFDMFNARTAALLDENLQRIDYSSHVSKDQMDCAELLAFFSAANACMCVRNSAECLELFCLSLRVRNDLRRAVARDSWNMSIICREWVDLPLQSEWRGFVKDGKLTAVSQYFWFAYWPELQEQLPSIRSRIRDYFYMEIKPRVPIKDYVIDFALGEERIWVIELSKIAPLFFSFLPFCCTSSSPMT